MPWIEGKRVVVTGATSGIGRAVASALAAGGADVVLACRDRARAEAVANAIATSTPGPGPRVLSVDTSDARSIRRIANQYVERYKALDVLVNNAGILIPERTANAAGVELTFATNVLGYYLLATELSHVLPTPPSRIVNVASTFAFALDLDDLQFQRRPYDGMAAYAQSKACDRLLTWALARRLEPQGVAVNATAPGLVLETSLYRALTPDARRELEQYGPGRQVRLHRLGIVLDQQHAALLLACRKRRSPLPGEEGANSCWHVPGSRVACARVTVRCCSRWVSPHPTRVLNESGAQHATIGVATELYDELGVGGAEAAEAALPEQ